MSVKSSFERIRADLAQIPVIDCHKHAEGPAYAKEYEDGLAAVIGGYIQSDLRSASSDREIEAICDGSKSLKDRWPLFERVWKRTEHTGYARVTKWVMREIYGEPVMSLDALERIDQKIIDLSDDSVYWGVLDRANIRCRIVNIWGEPKSVLDGSYQFPGCDRLVIPLPLYHAAITSYGNVMDIGSQIDRKPITLDEYVDVCREIFSLYKRRGAIGMKDQSAYSRTLRFDNVAKYDAERLFNSMMDDPRTTLGWPHSKPLDDYLFHSFMRIARDLELPVQIHTGHMAGARNDIAKTNTVRLTNTLEMHRDVQFDLFHANWPNAGDFLYLGKNYPNVYLNFCWTHIIDPVYSQDVLYQAITSVPHGKIFGFGGDYGGVEYAAGHLEIARDNIGWALARHIDSGWLGSDEARAVAADWLFNNPNRFWRLGFEPVVV
ncbi:MAG: amidohydrolase family protein [Pirellulaceae bacterium]|jgi:hypothetical protein|nr:amidohydrolase family protein [Pirellulaceae bacterium]